MPQIYKKPCSRHQCREHPITHWYYRELHKGYPKTRHLYRKTQKQFALVCGYSYPTLLPVVILKGKSKTKTGWGSEIEIQKRIETSSNKAFPYHATRKPYLPTVALNLKPYQTKGKPNLAP